MGMEGLRAGRVVQVGCFSEGVLRKKVEFASRVGCVALCEHYTEQVGISG